MSDEWMPALRLTITYDEWRQLPRNASYKYEYLSDHAWLSPRPLYYHALLELAPLADQALEGQGRGVTIHSLKDGDWEELIPVFSAAFDRQQPFSGLGPDLRIEAARKALAYTRTGGDGPLLAQASFTAREAAFGNAVGGALVTILPDVDPTEWGAFHWKEPPPADWLERGLGRPHLTWIFVDLSIAGEGVGTTLLDAIVRTLLKMGYTQLASTFLSGNDSSILWHWRNGFRLLTYPGSKRKMGWEIKWFT